MLSRILVFSLGRTSERLSHIDPVHFCSSYVQGSLLLLIAVRCRWCLKVWCDDDINVEMVLMSLSDDDKLSIVKDARWRCNGCQLLPWHHGLRHHRLLCNWVHYSSHYVAAEARTPLQAALYVAVTWWLICSHHAVPNNFRVDLVVGVVGSTKCLNRALF